EHVGPVKAPARDEDKGPMIAAKRDPIEKFINKKYLIDMRKRPRPKNFTAEGWPRDQRWFWRQMLKEHPFLFSPDTQALITSGKVPIADETWIHYHPGQELFLGQKLPHHHLDRGPKAAG